MRVKIILLSFALTLFFGGEAIGWCIKKFNLGNSCDKSKKEEKDSKTVVNVITGAGGAKASIFDDDDGGAVSRYQKGDKSKYQGYAEYKSHFLYYSYEFLAVPHQRALRSSDTDNKAYGYEYAFNPYISFKIQQSELQFKGFDAGDEFKYTNLNALLNLRVYLLRNVVIRTGIGLGETTVKLENEKDDTRNEKYTGQTTILQTGIFYIFGDENTMLGFTSTAIDGRSGETFNIGSSSYGLIGAIGF